MDIVQWKVLNDVINRKRNYASMYQSLSITYSRGLSEKLFSSTNRLNSFSFRIYPLLLVLGAPLNIEGGTEGAGKPDPPDILDRQICCRALASLRRSKWFQVCLQKSFNCSIVT